MLILTRYNKQRIVVIAPDGKELWITATDCGLSLERGDIWDSVEWLCYLDANLSGKSVVVTHLETRSKSNPLHRIGIDAPKDYLILREELLTEDETT